MTLTTIAAIFLAKLLSPTAAVLAIVVAYFAREWFHLLIGALGIAFVVELVLQSQQYARQTDPMIILIGLAAALLWCAIFYSVKSFWIARRQRSVSMQDR